MINTKILIAIFVCVLFVVLKYFFQPTLADRQKLTFVDSAKAVQDSMIVLRQICESVKAKGFMNCYLQPADSVLYFRGLPIGKLDSISISNKEFVSVNKKDVMKLLSVFKFLNRNYIAGVVHDTSIGFWLYSYKKYPDENSISTTRQIYIWRDSKDTLNPAFNYYLKILDRNEHMVLVGLNDVRYKNFNR